MRTTAVIDPDAIGVNVSDRVDGDAAVMETVDAEVEIEGKIEDKVQLTKNYTQTAAARIKNQQRTAHLYLYFYTQMQYLSYL